MTAPPARLKLVAWDEYRGLADAVVPDVFLSTFPPDSDDEHTDAEDDPDYPDFAGVHDIPARAAATPTFSLASYAPSLARASSTDLYHAINVPTFALVCERERARARDVNNYGAGVRKASCKEYEREGNRTSPVPSVTGSAGGTASVPAPIPAPIHAPTLTLKPKAQPKRRKRVSPPLALSAHAQPLPSKSAHKAAHRRPLQAKVPNAA